MAVARIALSDDAPFDHLKGRKESGRTVAFIVVGEGAAPSRFERQTRLGAIQRLNLTLLVHTKHDGILRRSEVTPLHR